MAEEVKEKDVVMKDILHKISDGCMHYTDHPTDEQCAKLTPAECRVLQNRILRLAMMLAR